MTHTSLKSEGLLIILCDKTLPNSSKPSLHEGKMWRGFVAACATLTHCRECASLLVQGSQFCIEPQYDYSE